MFGVVLFTAVIVLLADVVLWLRFLRPTTIVWKRRSSLIAAILGSLALIPSLVVIAQYEGIFK